MVSTKSIQNSKSFTLIELVMAVVIVSIISIPISTFICENYRSLLQTSDYSIALDLARTEMEIANNTAFDSIVVIDYIYNNYQGYPYYVVRAVSYVLGSAATPERMIKIIVSVSRTATSPVILSLTSYRVRNVTHGP